MKSVHRRKITANIEFFHLLSTYDCLSFNLGGLERRLDQYVRRASAESCFRLFVDRRIFDFLELCGAGGGEGEEEDEDEDEGGRGVCRILVGWDLRCCLCPPPIQFTVESSSPGCRMSSRLVAGTFRLAVGYPCGRPLTSPTSYSYCSRLTSSSTAGAG